MKNDGVFTDRRLLQAIDLIDPKFIAEVFDDLKVPDTSKGYVSDKRGLHRAYRQFIALAACLILLSAAFPIAHYVLVNYDFEAGGWGSGTTEESSDILENDPAKETTAEQQYVYGAYLNPIKDLEPLPQGLLEEIDSKFEIGFSSFNVLNRGITFSDRYLGYIGEYYVFFNTSTGTKEGYMTANHTGELYVAGYDFYYSSPFSVILYKDGVTTNLKEAYDSGEITLHDVQKIYCRNNEYLRYFDSNLNFKDKVPVTEEEFNVVREAWISKYAESNFFASSFESTGQIDYYFYGHIGGNIIFHAGNPTYVGRNEYSEIYIDGFIFQTFTKVINIWVYNNGDILSLIEAYEQGWITYDDLSTISYMNNYVFNY